MKHIDIRYEDLVPDAQRRYLVEMFGIVVATSDTHIPDPIGRLEFPEPGTAPVKFTSVWDDDLPLTTDGFYNPETGEVVDVNYADHDPEGACTREFITLVDGTELDVCQTCHSYVLKTVMVPDRVGKGLHESKVCSDPDCDSHENDE